MAADLPTRAGPALGGVILAGGQSRRMGQPKAFLRLTPDGPMLIELVVAALATVADPITIVTNTPADYAFLGRPLVGDRFPGLGALAGIHAGLDASPTEHSLVVACDMPSLSPPLLAAMARVPRDYDVLIPRLADGQLETLHAIYGKACLAPIARRLAGGAGRVISFFDEVRVVYLDEPELRRHDPDLRSPRNLNTPDDLARARQP
jgi:molybdenum cofactor guanylyltransferase